MYRSYENPYLLEEKLAELMEEYSNATDELAPELDFVVERFKQIRNLEDYAETLKASGDYNNFETRLAWDCLRSTVPSSTICSWYEKYGCTDDHITTLAKTALKIARGGT